MKKARNYIGLAMIFMMAIVALPVAKRVEATETSQEQGAKRYLVKYKDSVKKSKIEKILKSETSQTKENRDSLVTYQSVDDNHTYLLEYAEEIIPREEELEIEYIEEDSKIHILTSTTSHLASCSCQNVANYLQNTDYVINDENLNDYCVCHCENCSMDCISNPCCEACIFYEPYQTIIANHPLLFNQNREALDESTTSEYYKLGDEIPWNILRTNSDALQNENITGKKIKVAVFDTGIDTSCTDLHIAGGISFVEGNTSYDDDNGHGTAMAGIIAAKANGQGLVGIAPNVDLYAVKILDENGEGYYSYIIQGIEWAIENDINIISLSLGGAQYSEILQEAIQKAIDHNILIVAAAGNAGSNTAFYPAAYPQVVCVGATDSKNILIDSSNYGSQLDLVAPGRQITTIGKDNTKITVDGTSPAASHVSGVAALLWSVDGTLTNGHIKYLLYHNANSVGDYEVYGHGLVDAKASFANLLSGDYSIYNDEGERILDQVDVGWDGVVTASCEYGYMDITRYPDEKDHMQFGHFEVAFCTGGCGGYGHGFFFSPTCAKCNIVPVIHIDNIADGQAFQSSSLLPSMPDITIEDKSGLASYVNMYIDGQKVNYTRMCDVESFFWEEDYDFRTLTEGKHTLRITITPRLHTSEKIITFYIDQTNPYINGITTSVGSNQATITADAGDALSGLADRAYRYTVDGTSTGWISDRTYTVRNLTPNCTYNCKVEVQDKAGNVVEQTKQFMTDVEAPIVTAIALQEQMANIRISDQNSGITYYSILIGDLYATENGVLTTTQTWFACGNSDNGRSITLYNLSPDTTYSIRVQAKGSTGVIKTSSQQLITTSPGAPTGISCTGITSQSISLAWIPQTNAYSYEIYRSIASDDGTTIGAEAWIGTTASASYVDTKVEAGCKYIYTIRCKAYNGLVSKPSSEFIAYTLPKPLGAVNNMKVEVEKQTATISWNSMGGGLLYEIQVTYDGKTEQYKTTDTTKVLTLGYDLPFEVKIRAYNVYDTINQNWMNAGEWGISSGHTDANVPILEEIEEEAITYKSATISWSANSNPASVRYGIHLYDKNQNLIKEIKNISGNTYTMTELSGSTDYMVTCYAINSLGMKTAETKSILFQTKLEKPGRPQKVKASTKSDYIKLSWDAGERAAYYQILRDGEILATHLEATEYIDKKLSYETTYEYQIFAVNQAGKSEAVTIQKTTLGEISGVPTGLSVTEKSISVTLTWEVVETATGYDLELDGVIYHIGEACSYVQKGVDAGSTHTYRVRSRNDYGKSDWSKPVTITTTPILPITPANLQIVNGEGDLLIRWEKVPQAKTYEVEINSVVYKNIVATEYLYHYDTATDSVSGAAIRVRAVNLGGEGAWSDSYYVSYLDTIGQSIFDRLNPPKMPVVELTRTDINQVNITWSTCENASSYEVEIDGNIVYTGNETEYQYICDYDTETTVKIKVRACNLKGNSDWSEEQRVSVLPDALEEPIIRDYSRVSSQVVFVDWDDVKGASYYVMEVNGTILDSRINPSECEVTVTSEEACHIRVGSVVTCEEKSYISWSEEITLLAPKKISKIPTNLIAEATIDSLSMQWSEAKYAEGYEVEIDGKRYVVSGGNTWLITGLEAGTTYAYRVRSYNESGYSDWSKTEYVMTNVAIAGVPLNIKCQQVETATGCAVKTSWLGVEGATEYEIEINHDTIIRVNQAECALLGLPIGDTSYIRIRAINEETIGAWSSYISFVPTLTKPREINAIRDGEMVALSWKQVEGAVAYEVEIDGMLAVITGNREIRLDSAYFYQNRSIRVRAICKDQAGEWSDLVLYSEAIPVSVTVEEGEEFTIELPAIRVEQISNYEMELVFDKDELELVDLFEYDYELSITEVYLEETKTNIQAIEEEDTIKITITINEPSYINQAVTKMITSIRVRSRVSGTVTIYYQVTTR